MTTRRPWTRDELLVAFALYCQLQFGRLHSRNPVIQHYAQRLGRTPSALAMKLTNIASLDPVVTESGRSGLSGASAADRAMWNEMINDWQGFARTAFEQLARVDEGGNRVGDIDLDQEAGVHPAPGADHAGIDVYRWSPTRTGQAFFRRSVISAYEGRCCITGLAIPELLVASHIIPWSHKQESRIDPRNGLCLNVLHDKAFDSGLITVDRELRVRVSGRLREARSIDEDPAMRRALQEVEGLAIRVPCKFGPLPEYLDWHREHLFGTPR